MNQEQKGTVESGTAASGGKSELIECVLRYFIAGGAAFILSVVLLMLVSFGVSKDWLDMHYLAVYVVISCLLSVLLAVKLVRRFLGEVNVVGGLIVGVIYFLLLLLFGYIGYSSLYVGQSGLWLGGACLLGGAGGGFTFNLNRGKKKTRKRRK